jgi:sugar phosphate isomerase/epimerase
MNTVNPGNFNSIIKMNNMNFDRRRFITTLAAAGAYVPISKFGSGNIFNAPQGLDRKIHVFTKPFQWLSYEEMSALVAESGAEGIDLPVRAGGHVLPEKVETDLPMAFEAAKKNGLLMDMIVTGITSADEKYTEPILKTASSLGIRHYRMGWINYDEKLGIMGTLQKLKTDMKKLEGLNRKYKIHGAYQNHSGTRVGGPVWDLYEIVKELDPEYIGIQYDVRHAVVEGGASWVNGFKLVMPWVRCTDIKDFIWTKTNGKWGPESVPLGEGMVNFDDYFKLVQKNNVTGPVSLHLEYPPFERFNEKLTDDGKKKLLAAAMKKDVEKLKSFRTKYQL